MAHRKFLLAVCAFVMLSWLPLWSMSQSLSFVIVNDATTGPSHSPKETTSDKEEITIECNRETCREIFVDPNNPLFQTMWSDCHCEDRFCRAPKNFSSNDGICRQWSPYGMETLLLRVNQSNVCDADHSNQFFPDPYWDRYQFTDYFQQRKIPVQGTKWDNWTCPYPNSLLDDYHKASVKEGVRGGHLDILFRLIQDRIANRTKTTTSEELPLLPLPNTLVIHLRLGDVVDRARDLVRDLLLEQKYFYPMKEQKAWNAYVKPLSYFSDWLARTKQHYSSVVIMGSAHKGQQNGAMTTTKSCLYTHVLQSYIERVFFVGNTTVTLRLGQSPDNDIIFASQAAGYVPSGGSFSKLIHQLNEMNHAYERKDFDKLQQLGQDSHWE